MKLRNNLQKNAKTVGVNEMKFVLVYSKSICIYNLKVDNIDIYRAAPEFL